MIADFITDISNTFFNPEKRVFIGYLLTAVILSLCWLVWVEKKSLLVSVQKIFSRSIWWSPSAKVDYKILFINKILLLILSPLLIAQLTIATIIFYQLYEWFPSRPQLPAVWPGWLIAAIFTFCYFLLDDFMRFYVHRLLHRWPLLWAFHKVHHSAETLTPLTVFRTHPVESIIFSLRSILVQAIAIGGFVFFMGERADLITVLGASVIIFLFNLLGANIRHSHVAIRYWKPLERFLMSPAQHQIHHSLDKRHYDKNYGVVLAIWDYLFDSHHYSEKNQQLVFGLQEQSANPHSLWSVYCLPLVECFNLLKKRVSCFYSLFFLRVKVSKES